MNRKRFVEIVVLLLVLSIIVAAVAVAQDPSSMADEECESAYPSPESDDCENYLPAVFKEGPEQLPPP